MKKEGSNNFRILAPIMTSTLNLLSFSIYSNKGVYALLLGSGISRNSGIPTGWDIVLDLIKKIALLEGADCGSEPDKWYREIYQEEPDYSVLLEKLAKTPTERLGILKDYFEASESEDEAELKQPTKAHESIAKLVKKGCIKVVVTTNFDRLLETALRNEGIEPTVIRHLSDIAGATPLVHNPFTMLKINGDYLDSRFLNTKEELEQYDSELQNYLKRIIDEYGIISCGWSGKWDNALIKALKMSSNHRYSSFWTHLANNSPELNDIATLRKGQTLKIDSADNFFTELFERIDALERNDSNDGISMKVSIARAKKYLAKPEYTIQLHDLLAAEGKRLKLSVAKKELLELPVNAENLKKLLDHVIESTLYSLPLLMTYTYWCKVEHYQLLIDFISSTAKPLNTKNSHTITRKLLAFPALLQLYSVGILALKNGNFKLLDRIFKTKITHDLTGSEKKDYLINAINSSFIDFKDFNSILKKTYHTPISSEIKQLLIPLFDTYTDSPTDYDEHFHLFEYLLSLNYIHIVGPKHGRNWAPYGEYKWRELPLDNRSVIFDFIQNSGTENNDWPPVANGMFNYSILEFENARKKLHEFLDSFHIH